jgi:TolB protein
VGVAIVLAIAVSGSASASGRQPSGLIAFDAVTNGAGYEQVYVADLGSGRVRQLTKTGGYNPSWSPDGSHIAFEYPSEGPCGSPACSSISIVAADGSDRHLFTPPRLRCEAPAWSPRGDLIAYVQWRNGIDASIYTRSMAGVVHRLTHATNAFDSNPVWSPDGARIVFDRMVRYAYVNYVMDADGTHLHRLDGNPNTTISSWSPDGSLLTGSRVWGLYNNQNLTSVLNADGTGERRLLSDGSDPAWSPDGRLIAFVPDNQDLVHGSVGVIGADGKGRHRLFAGRFTQPGNLDWLRRS